MSTNVNCFVARLTKNISLLAQESLSTVALQMPDFALPNAPLQFSLG